MKLVTTFDVRGWYETVRVAGRPVVWCSAFAPAEALVAAGLIPVYPENHAAMLGVLSPTRDPLAPYSATAIAAAAVAGHTGPKLCSYALSDLGVLVGGAPSPLGRMPGPDAFYACDSQCRVVERWGEAVAAHLGGRIPHYVLHAPVPGPAGHTPEQLAGFRRELDGHLDDIAARFGLRATPERLREVIAESGEANRLWQSCLELGRHRPTPWTVWEAFTAMAPIVIARGFPEATAYYRALLTELQERVRDGIAAVPGERRRILWDAIPVWPRRRWLERFCAERGVAAVVSTYTHSWWFDFDAAAGLDGLCARYAWNTMNLPVERVLDWTVGLARDFSADRVICHWNRSCGIWNSYVKRRLPGLQAAGLPTYQLEADMVDPAAFDEARIARELDAFLA